ncbi:hypothetical protein Syun_018904 [Stephania yunnanensis]|uniref:Uncharacterized protein n=1 Tax=Stephania yunnanensis TaxID=152371 RepID=A0AAP0IT38_9MAGN
MLRICCVETFMRLENPKKGRRATPSHCCQKVIVVVKYGHSTTTATEVGKWIAITSNSSGRITPLPLPALVRTWQDKWSV